MSIDPETTRIVRSWLRTDEHQSADRVLDTVLAEIDTTPQRRATWWPARRLTEMNNAMRIAVASAAVIAVALIGIGILRDSDVGGPGLIDSSPLATPAPTGAPLADQETGTVLEPGTYFTEVAGHRVFFTVPTGWQLNAVPSVIWTPGSDARVSFGQLDNLNADACAPLLGALDPAVGPTVDDLAAALAAMPGVSATTSDVTVGGRFGKRVDVEVPAELGDCVAGNGAVLYQDLPLDVGTHRFWILGVDGDRVLIHTVRRTGVPDRIAGQLQAIAESVRID